MGGLHALGGGGHAVLTRSIVVVVFLILNFFLMSAGSSGAVPAKQLFGVLAMWLLVSAPLCFVGAYLGFKRPVRDAVVAAVRKHTHNKK